MVEEELEELSEEVVEEELEELTELSDTSLGDKGLESSSLEHAISTRNNNEVKPTITENFLYFKNVKNCESPQWLQSTLLVSDPTLDVLMDENTGRPVCAALGLFRHRSPNQTGRASGTPPVCAGAC